MTNCTTGSRRQRAGRPRIGSARIRSSRSTSGTTKKSAGGGVYKGNERGSEDPIVDVPRTDRKSTRLNPSHLVISYAVFCLKKKKRGTYDEEPHNSCQVSAQQQSPPRLGTSAPCAAVGQAVRLGGALPGFRSVFFFFNDTATTEIYTLSLHDALPIYLFLPGCGHECCFRNRYRRARRGRSEEHTSELQSPCNLVCRLLLEKKKKS